ncbi:MAG: glycosyltransferase family 2 protein [Chloroflexi bacterium]|nr:glycosyltransferase family 2 protein [Chloroflexota bacterium]
MIIPAHNEEKRLPDTLAKIEDFLARQTYGGEIVVVENGSRDRTAAVVEEFAETHPNVRLIAETRRGKGLAVREGMRAARGEFRFICDADLSMPIDEVNKFLPPALDSYDVAIGSREAPGARRYDEPLYRHWMGRVFSNLVKVFAFGGFEDTQCGFKCFRANAARDLFEAQVLDGMSFDVEVLFIALRRGYKIVEVPIDWYYMSESRVRLVGDSLRMLADIMTVRRNWREGRYHAHSQI